MRIAPFHRSIILLLALSGLVPLPAQDLACDVFSTLTNVRGEDKTAILGDILISCQAADPDPPAAWQEKTVSIIVNLPINVANNTGFGGPSYITDAVLVVNENNCETPTYNSGSYMCSQAYQDPLYGKKTANKEIAWDGVVVPFPGAINPRTGGTNPSTTTIRITSMRGNASSLGVPSGSSTIPIEAIVSTEPPSTLSLGVPLLTIAFSKRGLNSSVESMVTGTQCVDPDSGAASTAVIKLAEGFSSAFRVQGSPTYYPADALTESGYFAPGSHDGGGAESPTIIGLLFSKIPAGVSLSAPTTVQDGALTLTAEAKSCEATGMESVSIDSGGDGVLVYKVCGADPSVKENVDVPVAVSWDGHSLAGLGTGKVQVTFLPLGATVPAFAKTGSATTFLNIQKCAEPPPPPPPVEDKPYLTKMSVYNDGHWLRDSSGDGLLGADDSETSFGFKGAMPLAGDWDGDAKQEIAVYANIFGMGLWFLDLNGNGTWDDGVDLVSVLGWGNSSAKPVVGDWNGDGRSKIGVYSNGLWLLDYDGNGVLNGNDKIFELGGWQGSVPLVGDWNGDGRASAGIYAQGHFVLDYNADHHFENGAEDRVYQFGISGANVEPLIGDWTGNGVTKIGIFRAGQWSLDLNGDGLANGTGESLFFFGPQKASPVVGDWAGIGKDTIGAIDDGAWYLDINGDRVHNGLDPILFWGDEGDNRIFVPGKWRRPAQ